MITFFIIAVAVVVFVLLKLNAPKSTVTTSVLGGVSSPDPKDPAIK